MKPHLSRYWLNTTETDPVLFATQVQTVCELYAQAPQLAAQGVHLISTDEMTSIQALERLAPTKGLQTGATTYEIARVEFEYVRHGTTTLLANLEVATGRIVSPTLNPTRTEADYLAHLQNLIATDPDAAWIILSDQLNTHQGASLVEWVASACKLEVDLGAKGKYGILKDKASRQAFLADASHRIRMVYTPKHSSWLNQIEIWFSILVRKLLKRGNFSSVAALQERILAFIGYYNAVLAKPFAWTYKGKVLQV